MVNHKETFMKEALKEAKKAYKKLEIPVGAVIVKDGEIIAKAHNLRENKNSSIAHAEILAIEKANKKLFGTIGVLIPTLAGARDELYYELKNIWYRKAV